MVTARRFNQFYFAFNFLLKLGVSHVFNFSRGYLNNQIFQFTLLELLHTCSFAA